MSKYHSFNKLKINFDTSDSPPPWCHRFEMDFMPTGRGLSASVRLEYYGRSELSEEEIFDEGFSSNDDFEWSGELPAVWASALRAKLSKTNWTKQPGIHQGGMMTLKLSDKGSSELLYPANVRNWEVFAEEMMQAMFELGGKEAPLSISFVQVGVKKEASELKLLFRFSSRTIELTYKTGKLLAIEWPEGQKLLKHIFMTDFLPDDALDKLPTEPGSYISPGDGWWYQMDKNLLDIRDRLINTIEG
jgi:hypothetical protein